MRKTFFLLCLIAMLSACVTTHEDRAAVRGGAVGATAGAVIGADSGNAAEGAVIGGVLGAAAGVLLDQSAERRTPHSQQSSRVQRRQPVYQTSHRHEDSRYRQEESDDRESNHRRYDNEE